MSAATGGGMGIVRHKILHATPRGQVVETRVTDEGNFVLYRDHVAALQELQAKLDHAQNHLQADARIMRNQDARQSVLGRIAAEYRKGHTSCVEYEDDARGALGHGWVDNRCATCRAYDKYREGK